MSNSESSSWKYLVVQLLRIGLLHTEQGCSIDLMFPEFTVVLQQVFPGIISITGSKVLAEPFCARPVKVLRSVIFTFNLER